MLVQRKNMTPGTVFVDDFRRPKDAPLTLVVVDRYREIEFWTGARSVYGDVLPNCEFEVIS
jgi:hypothetical protein